MRALTAPIRLALSPGRIGEAVEGLARSARALRHSLNPPAPRTAVFNQPVSPLRSLARVGTAPPTGKDRP